MLIGETVTRLRYSTTADSYGNPVRTGTPAELDMTGALFAPSSSSEPVEVGRTSVIDTPTVYFPGQWPDLLATDQLRIRGAVFEVIGDSEDWRSGVGSSLGGFAVPVKRVDG